MFAYCTCSASLAARLGGVPVTASSHLGGAHIVLCDDRGALWLWRLAPNYEPHSERDE